MLREVRKINFFLSVGEVFVEVIVVWWVYSLFQGCFWERGSLSRFRINDSIFVSLQVQHHLQKMKNISDGNLL